MVHTLIHCCPVLAACLTLWSGCSSRAIDPAVDLGTDSVPKIPDTDGGSRRPDAGPSADGGECIPPSPVPGCDFCGNLECPPGSSIDSACKCLNADGNGYVTPLAQTCDFCCGKVCPAGEFFDFACECYAL